ncbi:MAG TPA: helix-turn-helix domain-containing protein [Planktothrix sp.]|jgi:AcrR family transcriptional regulator
MVRTLDETKRSSIMVAARTIFIKDGYTAAKMSDIASEAGVAPGTLYLYFENKEALGAAIGEELFSRLAKQFSELIQAIEIPDDIIPLVDWALRVSVEDRDMMVMAKEHKDTRAGRRDFLGLVSKALGECMAHGTIRKYDDVAILADLVLATMRRLLMSCAFFEDAPSEALRAGAIEFLQHALFDDVTIAASRLLKRKG